MGINLLVSELDQIRLHRVKVILVLVVEANDFHIYVLYVWIVDFQQLRAPVGVVFVVKGNLDR